MNCDSPGPPAPEIREYLEENGRLHMALAYPLDKVRSISLLFNHHLLLM
jgi:hypothetical protein